MQVYERGPVPVPDPGQQRVKHGDVRHDILAEDELGLVFVPAVLCIYRAGSISVRLTWDTKHTHEKDLEKEGL